jgi:thiosulfate reductase cytochrome b subunit
VADTVRVPLPSSAARETAQPPRHTALVRVTHWIATLSFLALLVSGLEIVVSHPRFYWGETGHVFTAPLFTIPIPASRPYVPTGYNFVMPDQNGWSRSLHFQSAWFLVFTGLLYVVSGLVTRHFRRNLVPRAADLSGRALAAQIGNHLRLRPPHPSEAWSYNSLQRITYMVVIFALFPLAVWTGLAMSPAVVSAFPPLVTILGGQQSARTIHFFLTIVLSLFLVVHIGMICLAGFRSRTRSMITGRAAAYKEQP